MLQGFINSLCYYSQRMWFFYSPFADPQPIITNDLSLFLWPAAEAPPDYIPLKLPPSLAIDFSVPSGLGIRRHILEVGPTILKTSHGMCLQYQKIDDQRGALYAGMYTNNLLNPANLTLPLHIYATPITIKFEQTPELYLAARALDLGCAGAVHDFCNLSNKHDLPDIKDIIISYLPALDNVEKTNENLDILDTLPFKERRIDRFVLILARHAYYLRDLKAVSADQTQLLCDIPHAGELTTTERHALLKGQSSLILPD